jgi:prevent-host-death family protein
MINITVSSGDFLKAYGRISETALREPVSITSHGRERLVLLSADEYRRLRSSITKPPLNKPWRFPMPYRASSSAMPISGVTKRDAGRRKGARIARV